MKRILLLGGYGFIGTNILSYIDQNLKNEYEVVVFDKLSSHYAGLSFDCVKKSYSGDFSDNLLIDNIFNEEKIDIVIHSISTTIPATSFNAKYDIESNLVPTIELLNCMVKHQVYDIIYISSGGAVYGNGVNKHKESDDVFPVSSYGVVKLSIEKYLMQYAQLYGLKPLILRLSNPYGKFHYSMKQGVINVALASAVNEHIFSIWGDGNSSKDYIFIDDFVDIMFLLMKSNINSSVVNIASNQLLSVNQIVNSVKGLIPSFTWEYKDSSKLDVSRFALNNTKLLSLIGDYKFTPFEEGLSITYNWLIKK